LAASPYCEIGAENGFLLLVFSNTDPCMSFPGGDKNVIGNNPLGFGLPRSGGVNLMLDVCMAYSSLGNMRAYAKEGKAIPGHWAKSADGNWTTDPLAALDGGSIQPMAQHKGFGLSLMTEALTGLLSGGETGNNVAHGGGINTHNQSIIAFDLAAFGGADAVGSRADDLAGRLKADDPRIRLPGEHSHVEEKRLLSEGVALDAKLVEALRAWQTKLGVREII
jgi:LDH2 family malate/lactate/ureidoglycolate dehydrogenase